MERIRYWVKLQIRVGQDDKFDKENIVFLKAQNGNYGYFIKEMARKA